MLTVEEMPAIENETLVPKLKPKAPEAVLSSRTSTIGSTFAGLGILGGAALGWPGAIAGVAVGIPLGMYFSRRNKVASR